MVLIGYSGARDSSLNILPPRERAGSKFDVAYRAYNVDFVRVKSSARDVTSS